MTDSLPCYSCAAGAAGKPKCAQWCGLPGKCLSNMTPPTDGFCTFEFWEREAQGHITPFHDFNAMKALLEASGVRTLTNAHNYQISIARSDLPRLIGRLERILRAIAPYLEWSKPNDTHGVTVLGQQTESQHTPMVANEGDGSSIGRVGKDGESDAS